MTTNPPGNDSGTPIHDRTAAAERDFDEVLRPEGDVLRPQGFDDVEPLDALPADEQLPATPSAAGASAPYTESTTTTSAGYVPGTAGSGASGSSLPGLGNTGSTGTGSDSTGGGKADAAKGAAQDVAGDAKEQAANVAGTAKEQASNVASDATEHAKQLYAQASDTLKEQAAGQQERAAGGLRTLGEQLGRMADKDDEQGIAAKVVRDLSSRAGSAAGYLEGRDPGSLLAEVKSFAAKRPGTFIALAAGAGILAGRLTKALATEVKHEKEAGGTSAGTGTTPSAGTSTGLGADGTVGGA